MNDTTRELGGALGVAVLGSLVTTSFRRDVQGTAGELPARAAEQVDSGLAGALRAAETLPDDAASALGHQAREAFTSGFGTAALVAAGLVVVAALVLRRVLAEPRRTVTDVTDDTDGSGAAPAGVEVAAVAGR